MAFEVEAGSESRRNVNRTTDPVSARRYCGSRSNSSLFEFELIVLENSSWASRRSNNRACSTGLWACRSVPVNSASQRKHRIPIILNIDLIFRAAPFYRQHCRMVNHAHPVDGG